MTHWWRSVGYFLLLLFCLLTSLPLAASWTETARAKPKFDQLHVALLVLVSGSFSWIVLLLIFPLAIGPFHSEIRSTVIRVNAFLMLLVAIAAFARKRDVSAVVLAACLTSLVWFYIAAVNAVA